MSRMRGYLVWGVLVIVIAIPILAAATSPLLAWRQPVYIVAGFAGVAGMALLLVQPLLAGGYLPGLAGTRGRRLHRYTGTLLIAAVLLHVGGLWITSPPDVVDALLFRSPTPFSVWGVLAMWAVLTAAFLAGFRRRLRLTVRSWRRAHTILAIVIVTGSVVHALLIEGTMEVMTKFALCALVVIVTVKVIVDLKVWTKRPPREV
ncbi:ferric reductase-like transmembrane domain-containing protein [uncultured Roseibium sp.]|uniref:ferric reductase-like transmembrane domain-containing protein n=1 Tax=uncultured Roseibium sp. TaxID=1936171 RepID=UPI002619DB29|nr:ferric reductase-like transmembrane domain-containing protein [uncultured Roseibium sp.]